MKLIITDNYIEMSGIAYKIVKSVVQENSAPVLGLATGSTPIGLYANMVADYKRGGISFASLSTYNLDEYVGLRTEDKDSYHYYMKEHLFKSIDIDPNAVHIPCGTGDAQQNCARYDALLDERVRDLQVLGLGSNGHIGFCEPNTPFDARTHIVRLADSTVQDNSRFFSMGKTPTHAITMGLCDILKAKKILLLVSGEAKARALRSLCYGVDSACPASYLNTHTDCTVIADTTAAALLATETIERLTRQ